MFSCVSRRNPPSLIFPGRADARARARANKYAKQFKYKINVRKEDVIFLAPVTTTIRYPASLRINAAESAERTTCPTGSEVSSTQSKSRDKVRDVAQGLGQKKPLEVLLAVHPGEPDSVCSELGGRELVLCGQVSELTRVGRELVRVAVRRHVVRHDVHTRHLVLLLPLHTPILEPDLYLTLCKTEGMRDLDATPPRQIAVEVELLFQLQGLVPGVRGPLPFRLAVGIHRTWKSKELVIAR